MHTVHVVLPAQVIALLSLLLPAATALVTKRLADPAVKALTLLALSVITSTFGAIAQAGGGFDLGGTLWTIGITFLSGALAHFGLLGPVRLTGSDGVIAKAIPGGIGASAGTR